MRRLATSADLGGLANFERFLDFVLLAFLLGLAFYGLLWLRRVKDRWSQLLLGGAMLAFVGRGVLVVGLAGREGLRAQEVAQETPEVGPTVETWELIGASVELAASLGLFLAGIALVYRGWLEAQRPRKKR